MPTNSIPLFLKNRTVDDLFEKQAAAMVLAKMADDEKKWPAQIHSELLRALPYVAQYDPEIVLDRVEGEAGAALGYAQIRNRTVARPQDDASKMGNVIRIPIIVQDRRLQPFLVFETGGATFPLTEDRVEQAMLNPAIFDTTARRVPSSPSLVDAMYPPYQQRQGFGRVMEPSAMGLSKLSSAPDGHTKEARSLRPSSFFREYGHHWLTRFEDTPFIKEALALQAAEAEVAKKAAMRRATPDPERASHAELDITYADLESKFAQWKLDNHGQKRSATLSKLASARSGEGSWTDCFQDTPFFLPALQLEKRAADLAVVSLEREDNWRLEEDQRTVFRKQAAYLEAKLAGWRLELVEGGSTEKAASAPEVNPELQKLALMELKFQPGQGSPGPQVFAKTSGLPKFKAGVLPQDYWFYPLSGTQFLMGVPSRHRPGLEGAKTAAAAQTGLKKLARAELKAAMTGQPSPGELVLVTKAGDGYTYQAPMRGGQATAKKAAHPGERKRFFEIADRQAGTRGGIGAALAEVYAPTPQAYTARHPMGPHTSSLAAGGLAAMGKKNKLLPAAGGYAGSTLGRAALSAAATKGLKSYRAAGIAGPIGSVLGGYYGAALGNKVQREAKEHLPPGKKKGGRS